MVWIGEKIPAKVQKTYLQQPFFLLNGEKKKKREKKMNGLTAADFGRAGRRHRLSCLEAHKWNLCTRFIRALLSKLKRAVHSRAGQRRMQAPGLARCQ